MSGGGIGLCIGGIGLCGVGIGLCGVGIVMCSGGYWVVWCCVAGSARVVVAGLLICFLHGPQGRDELNVIVLSQHTNL